MCVSAGDEQNERRLLYPPLPQDVQDMAWKLPEGRRSEDLYAQMLDSQCGAVDDSQAVEQYDGSLGVTADFVSAHQAAVGQLQWNDNVATIYRDPGNVSGERWCSGTLIAGNLFLTAGHCFDSLPRTEGGWQLPFRNGTNEIISPQEIAGNMHVNFNYQVDASGSPRKERQYVIEELKEDRLAGLDFAILTLSGNPLASFGVGTLARMDPHLQETICIIGHPAGVRKRIEAGPVTDLVGTEIRYGDIDTLGGNSGSGILLSPKGNIVGVHTQGGCTMEGGFNSGVRVSSLLDASPTLRGLAPPE
jgi:V8-like Glu-specific endopeptidase